tara:strand:- start:376 stop:612 length:237 start_codon:yes stop_codon:yes gene_type:complete
MNKLENAVMYVRIYVEKSTLFLQRISAKQKISIAVNKYLNCKITILEREELIDKQLTLIDEILEKSDNLDRELNKLKK